MPINEAAFQVRGVRDPQLAVHATSGLPVWLWANDGTRLLWANPAGAAVFGASNSTGLAGRTFGPADQHRRQVARLAGRLSLNGAIRLERLRGFGVPLGQLLTCACARLVFTGGGIGVLVAALAPVGRTLPYDVRVQNLIDDIDAPLAAFTPAGRLAATNAAAATLLSSGAIAATTLAHLGLDDASHDALRDGHAEATVPAGRITMQRVGQGPDMTLLAFIAPARAESPAALTAPFFTSETASTDTSAPTAPPPLQPQDLPSNSQPLQDTEPSLLPEAAPAPFDDGFALDLVDPPEAMPPAQTFTDRPVESANPLVPVTEIVAPPLDAAPHAASCAPIASDDAGGSVDTTLLPGNEPDTRDTVVADVASHGEGTICQPLADTTIPDEPALPAGIAMPIDVLPSIDVESDAAADGYTASTEAMPPAPEPRDTTPPASASPDEPALVARRHPLRFMWQMDAEGRFLLGSDEFSRLIGPRTATAFGRPWREIAEAFGLDPDGRVTAAVATRDTWSGITVNWPADGEGTRLPVELSGLPLYDRTRQFLGYRGFGVCRDLEGLARLAAQRQQDALLPTQPLRPVHDSALRDISPHDIRSQATMDLPMRTSDTPPQSPPDTAPSAHPIDMDHLVDSPPNVVPFRPATDLKTPTLTPVENNAFNELARQLASRLEAERRGLDSRDEPGTDTQTATPVISPELFANIPDEAAPAPIAPASAESLPAPRSHVPPHGESRRDTLLYDRMPIGILVYRLDRLLYANKAFLERVGYPDLQALAAAGGLDALYVETDATGGGSTSDEGAPVTIAASGDHGAPGEARLHGISWDGEAAHALIFSTAASPTTTPAVPPAEPTAPAEPPVAATRVEEELGTILDATDDGILIFDGAGRIVTCNRGAEVLFGYNDRDIVQCHLTDLFAPDDHDAVRKTLEATQTATSHLSREVKGRTRSGETVPLALTMGRTTANGERFFAIGRRLAQPQTSPADIPSDRRPSDRAASARADILARISHEVRTPLNAIIGFADVMIEERFGALGNDRYAVYMKDIRAAGERVLAIINDLLDLSRAETGKLDLTFARQDLNEMVEKCVTIMQPQANRERIIIRTSLAHALPPVNADAGALRQIVLNLVGNSIHVARAGGQVIVSTALTDLGDVVLRIRDTGRGFNHAETDGEPFRQPGAEQLAQDNVGINLSLTRALVEANQAQFLIKAAPQSGTLVEVAFSSKTARAI